MLLHGAFLLIFREQEVVSSAGPKSFYITPFVLQVQLFLILVPQLKFKLSNTVVSSVQDQRTEVQVQPRNSSSTSTFPV